MRKTCLPLLLASFLLVSLWAGGPAAAADPPRIDDSGSVQQMKNLIAYWVNALRGAANDANVVLARDALVKAYKDMEAKNEGYYFADQMAAVAGPVLAKGFEKDPLRQVKEINLAMALAQMPHETIQPALDAMVASANAGVRYYGWKGYRQVRVRVYAQGTQWAQKAMASADKAAKAETSATVLTLIFRMLELEAAKPQAVSQDVWESVQKQTLSTLSGNGPRWCARIRHGDKAMAETGRGAVAALASISKWAVQDKNNRKDLLQTLVNLAWYAGLAYIDAKGSGQSGEAFTSLLGDCEKALNAAEETNRTLIDRTLTDPKINTNPQAVIIFIDPVTKEKLGVSAWVDALKDRGVVQPPILKPATAPATAPAE